MSDYKEIFGEDEVSQSAMGGTELMKLKLMETVDHDLLKKHQIIVSRPRDIHFENDKKKILWLHDHHMDIEAQKLKNPEYAAKFDAFVFPSYWSMNMYIVVYGLPFEKCIVLKNALTDTIKVDVQDKWNTPKTTIDFIYTSTPQRGLSILYEVFKKLCEAYSSEADLRLHVYSNFDIYGHTERNAPFEELYEKCRTHPNITYYGSRPHSEIEEALKTTDVWVLPSIWPETSCIAAMEAMSAGNILVSSNLAALPETTAGFGVVYPYVRNINDHAARLFEQLSNSVDLLMESRTSWMNHFVLQKIYADTFYNWQVRSKEWEIFLHKF